MLFSIGTRVRIRHTGEEGIVRRFLDDDMLEVYLPNDDFSIPVSTDDLIRSGTPDVPAPMSETEQDEPTDSVPDEQIPLLQTNGFLLAFEPGAGHARYRVFLINNSDRTVLYSFRRLHSGSSALSGHGKVEPATAKEVDEILKTRLGAQTAYQIDCWPMKKGGTGRKREREIRLRPKNFFRQEVRVPILERVMHTFELFTNWEEEAKTPREDLRTYTKKHLRPSRREEAEVYFRRFSTYNAQEFAEFEPEIDLHIQALRPDADALPRKDILRIQLDAFEDFLSDAIRLGVDRVFVIHGIGKGKLRSAIFTRLMNNPEVTTFRNEYHPKYGYGATEIILD